MGLQDGLELAGRSRRVGRTRRRIARSWRRGCCGSSTAEGSWKRTRVAHVSIGCLQRAELIVALDRAHTQDMRAAILDGVGIPTYAIVRPTGSLQTVTRRGAVEITPCRMHMPSYGRHATAKQSATRRGNEHARTLMKG